VRSILAVGPILGIDPGITCTGYGLIEAVGDRLILVASGDVRPSPSDSFPLRLKEIFDGLNALLASHAPTGVAVEEVFLARNFPAALKLGQARGVALLVAATHHLPVFEYSPTQVKMAVVGYGRASKEQVGLMVSRLLNLSRPVASEHAADALAIAICHIHSTPAHSANMHPARNAGRVARLQTGVR